MHEGLFYARMYALAEDAGNQATALTGRKHIAQGNSCETVLAAQITDELIASLENLRSTWKESPTSVPKGLSCSESKSGQFVLVAAESAFVTLPGACVIKGIGAIELLGPEPAFEAGANSKTLVLKATPEGWQFSVKFVRPIVRERNAK